MYVNLLRRKLEWIGETRYRFWKTTGLDRRAAYKLINDPSTIPTSSSMTKIKIAYGWEPKDYLYWLEC